jgi:uncharacterized protein
VKQLLLTLLRFYRRHISPRLPPSCRFTPTCSQYTYESIERFGAAKGSWMGLKRLSRCHPFNPGGYDPVPPATIATGSSRAHNHPEHGASNKDDA